MEKPPWFLLGTAALTFLAGCSASLDTSVPEEEDPDTLASESARQDLVCEDAGEESTGSAPQPLLSVVAQVTCELAAVLITEHICNKVGFWEHHCPAGTSLIIHDTMTPKTTAISCDTLKEITCGSGAFAADRLARFIFCKRIF